MCVLSYCVPTLYNHHLDTFISDGVPEATSPVMAVLLKAAFQSAMVHVPFLSFCTTVYWPGIEQVYKEGNPLQYVCLLRTCCGLMCRIMVSSNILVYLLFGILDNMYV